VLREGPFPVRRGDVVDYADGEVSKRTKVAGEANVKID
jgi:hypothetical protein